MARLERWLRRPALPVAVGVLLTLPSLWNGLALDDYWHWAVLTQPESLEAFVGQDERMFTFGNGDPERNRQFIALGAFPWWTLDTFRVQFWRPVTELSHWMDYRLWPDAPWLMHVQSVAWYGAVLALAVVFYRRWLTPAWVAGLAALLYAVDEAHAIPAGWLANRNALLAAAFALAVLLLHDTWRRENRRWAAPLACLALAAGLLSNEGAVTVTMYLFAYALFLDGGAVRSRIWSLVPYAAVVIAWQIAYKVQDYGAHGSQLYINPPESPVRFLEVLPIRFPALMMALWSPVPAEPMIFMPSMAQGGIAAVATAFFGLLAVALWPLLRTDHLARFFFTGMVLSSIPACATFPSDRLMFIPGIGAMGLIAQFIAAWRDGLFETRWTGLSRWLARPALVFLTVTHVVIAPIALAGKTVLVGATGRVFDQMALGAPVGDDSSGATIVVVNAPNIFVTTYLPIARARAGAPFPTRLISLAPMTARGVPIRLYRSTAETLIVEPESGYPWLLFRSDDYPFAAGDRVELEGWTVEVLEVDGRGVPLRIAAHFDKPLEDPSYVWLEFVGRNVLRDPANTYGPFVPPGVAEVVVIDGPGE